MYPIILSYFFHQIYIKYIFDFYFNKSAIFFNIGIPKASMQYMLRKINILLINSYI